MNGDNKLPPDNIFTDTTIYGPPKLRRERRSDYGVFGKLFEEDVYNWFNTISNQKRRNIIRHLELMNQIAPEIEPPIFENNVDNSLSFINSNVTTVRRSMNNPEPSRTCVVCNLKTCICIKF